MKIFKLMAIALVAMLGFTACDKETEHIYDDHSQTLLVLGLTSVKTTQRR